MTAIEGGRIVGVAGFRVGGYGLTGGTAGDVLRAYGVPRGLLRLPLLALLERTPAAGQLVMDGIAVDPGCRGSGIGGRLLAEVYAVAAAHGCTEVRLDVIDVNPRPAPCTNGRASKPGGPSRRPGCAA